MKINFLEIAQLELDDAIEYYNYEVPGLGDAFLTEVLNALRIGGRATTTYCIDTKRAELERLDCS